MRMIFLPSSAFGMQQCNAISTMFISFSTTVLPRYCLSYSFLQYCRDAFTNSKLHLLDLDGTHRLWELPFHPFMDYSSRPSLSTCFLFSILSLCFFLLKDVYYLSLQYSQFVSQYGIYTLYAETQLGVRLYFSFFFRYL